MSSSTIVELYKCRTLRVSSFCTTFVELDFARALSQIRFFPLYYIYTYIYLYTYRYYIYVNKTVHTAYIYRYIQSISAKIYVFNEIAFAYLLMYMLYSMLSAARRGLCLLLLARRACAFAFACACVFSVASCCSGAVELLYSLA